MKNVNKQRRNFISLSELGYEPQGNNFRGFAYIWQSKWVGIIAIKTERTQIHFLSDVLVAVASSDLFKVAEHSLRAVSDNSRNGACFTLDKQTWCRKRNGTQKTISQNLVIKIL